ncbi:unnamed protein product [Haemonchus placei]|uniref:Peptidase aspartic putative domain-containing protein n=1 Tax=Haemonchus placei TaxID=6290 RepID=A0A0N4WTM2_HAEPC|nr:unnamed protein product [Haemonchus placei]
MIEETLTNDFGLPKLFTETCTMSGIGGHVERFDSTTEPLRVRSAYGKELRFNVQTKPILTNEFPSVKLTEEDANFLEHNQICVANSNLQGERQVPLILVGLDKYHDLVIKDGVPQRTPSGLRIAKTVFGRAIYGRGRLDNPAEQSVSFGLMAIHEGSEDRISEKPFNLEEQGVSSDDRAADSKIKQHFESNPNSLSINIGYVTAPFKWQCNISKLENEAFTQIGLEDAHKELCRPLCSRYQRLIMGSNMAERRFNRLPFGVIASPSILNMASLAFLRSKGTELSAERERNLDMDNISLQPQSEGRIPQRYKESKSSFSKIGMNFREYVSSTNNNNMTIPKNDRAPSGKTNFFALITTRRTTALQ